jgi:hypothetical protein
MSTYSYVKLPIMWVATLLSRGATAADWKVAAYLLMEARFTPLVKLTNAKTTKFGISPRTKWRSINKLAQWGLIREKCQPGKSPIIRVLHLAGRQPSDG